MDDEVTRNSTALEMIAERDGNSAMDVRPNYSVDVPIEKD